MLSSALRGYNKFNKGVTKHAVLESAQHVEGGVGDRKVGQK
jgi:hypothetical protein